MPDQITIAGHPFSVPLRYEEGHELSAKEADALNRAYHENLRNCFAPRVKTAIRTGIFDLAVLQNQFDSYAQAYQFGQRQPKRHTTGDPVAKKALELAKADVTKQLRQKGLIASVTTEAITNKAKWLVLNRPHYMEQARVWAHAAQAIAQDDLTDFVWNEPRAAE
jgi:hypothetical protein